VKFWEKVQAWFVGIRVKESKELGTMGMVGRNNCPVIRELLKEGDRCCICNEYIYLKMAKPRTIPERVLFFLLRKPSYETNWGGTCGQGRNYCSDYFCVTHLFVDLEASQWET
jgi:hypothetical protein